MKFSDPPMELRNSVPCLESGCEIPTYTVDTAKVQGVDGPFEPRIDLQSWAKILPKGDAMKLLPFPTLHAARWLEL